MYGPVDGLLQETMHTVARIQIHHHTHTCKKGGHAGNNLDCRMGFPIPMVAISKVDAETGHIYIKRSHTMIVPYLRSLMMAQGCNHAIYPCCSNNRYLRDVFLWEQRPAHSKATRPTCSSPVQAAAEAAEYALKYSCKVDNQEINGKFHGILQQIITSANTSGTESLSSRPEVHRAKTFLMKALNVINGTTTYSSSMAAAYLLGHGDNIRSHNTAPHLYSLFATSLQRQMRCFTINYDPERKLHISTFKMMQVACRS